LLDRGQRIGLGHGSRRAVQIVGIGIVHLDAEQMVGRRGCEIEGELRQPLAFALHDDHQRGGRTLVGAPHRDLPEVGAEPEDPVGAFGGGSLREGLRAQVLFEEADDSRPVPFLEGVDKDADPSAERRVRQLRPGGRIRPHSDRRQTGEKQATDPHRPSPRRLRSLWR
jgi:hypothetical protein